MQSHPFTLNTLSSFNTLIKQSQENLSHSEFRVLMVIFSHRNSHSYACFPSIRRLSDEAVCRQSTVVRCVKSLEDSGYIVTCKRRSEYDNRNLSTQYWFCCELDTIHKAFRDEETSGFFENHHPDVCEWYHATRWE